MENQKKQRKPRGERPSDIIVVLKKLDKLKTRITTRNGEDNDETEMEIAKLRDRITKDKTLGDYKAEALKRLNDMEEEAEKLRKNPINLIEQAEEKKQEEKPKKKELTQNEIKEVNARLKIRKPEEAVADKIKHLKEILNKPFDTDNHKEYTKAQKELDKLTGSIERAEIVKHIKRINKIKTKERGHYKPKEKLYYFITINPQEETTTEEITEIMRRINKKEWIKMWVYVYEQRGETAETRGTGKHIHMTITKTRPQSEVKNILWEVVKNHCGDKNKIYIEEMDERGKLATYKYMRGIKKETGNHDGQIKGHKAEAMEQTKQWRTENNLKQIYIIKKVKEEDDAEVEKELTKIYLKENGYENTPTEIYTNENEPNMIIIIDSQGHPQTYKRQ